MKAFFLALMLSTSALFAGPQELKTELGIHTEEIAPQKSCHIYLVHHASTAWSEIKRLQGWLNLPLSEKGRLEAVDTAEKLSKLGISAIYTSSLQSSVETGQILQNKLGAALILSDQLKGEYHGSFDGMTREEYTNHPHFQIYKSLPNDEELFFPCGLGGESKATVAKRAIPFIEKIAAKHPGENIVVITHGGVFKLLNYYMNKFDEKGNIISIPYGSWIEVEATADGIYCYSHK